MFSVLLFSNFMHLNYFYRTQVNLGSDLWVYGIYGHRHRHRHRQQEQWAFIAFWWYDGAFEDMMTLTCCQDHILTENIWFVWAKTLYCGDVTERRRRQRWSREDRASQPMHCIAMDAGWLSFATKNTFETPDFRQARGNSGERGKRFATNFT